MIEGTRASEREALAAYRALRADRLPTIGGEARYTRLSDNIPEIDFSLPGSDETFTLAPIEFNQYTAQVYVEQPLFTGMRLHNEIRAAGHRADAAGFEVAQTRADVAFDIRQAYWRLYEAMAVRDAVDASLAQVEVHLQDVVNQRDAGTALQSDVLRAQTQRSDVQLDRIEAENAVRLARLELNRLTGLPLDTQIEPAADVTVAPLQTEVDSLIERALAARPRIRALTEEVEALEAGVAATGGAWYPDVRLTGRYVYARPNQYFFTEQDEFNGTWEGGVVLRWTLWNGGQRQSEVQRARARLQQAEAQLAVAQEQVIMDVSRQYLVVQRSVEAATVAAQYVDEAEETLRVIQQHFQEGVALSADVLDAERALRTAQSRRAQAVTDYATAHAALLHALGLSQ